MTMRSGVRPGGPMAVTNRCGWAGLELAFCFLVLKGGWWAFRSVASSEELGLSGVKSFTVLGSDLLPGFI